ncbi:MAG: cobalamin-binding protein [Gammaproteobacteria bacterium]|nr:cobalamin-binding protein [Gammaproteobacteria bacterium]
MVSARSMQWLRFAISNIARITGCRRLAGVEAAILLAAGLLLPFAAWPASVADDRGATVSVAGPAERVVSLAPFITELVFAAGGGDSLVAVSEHSDFPEAARHLPRIGNAFSVNLERLLAVQPDLVVSWQSGIDPRIVERLESMGIPVFVLEPRELEDVASALRRLGRLLGSEEAADEKAREFTAAIDGIRNRYAGRATVSVFYQISRRPLMTLNGEHMISDILAICGGANVFHGLSPIAPTVNREQVLAADPEVILISAATGRAPESLAYWRRYPAMTAVRHGNLYTVDGGVLNRQTPRLADGVGWVCEILDRARENMVE